MNHADDVREYFSGKAEKYDLVDTQVYWILSDKLLWGIFQSQVLVRQRPDFHFLDAGGGPEMLTQAKAKRAAGLENRLNLIEGDIQDMHQIPDGQFDVVFNFHNVLGFVESPDRAIREMTRVAKRGSYVAAVVPNLYHNLYFNLLYGNIAQAEQVARTMKGRFTPDMPEMHLFTPASMRELYGANGLKNVIVLGFPVTTYPCVEETQIEGSAQRITELLGTEDKFNRVYELEKRIIVDQQTATRGNNLFVAGTKILDGG